MDNFFIRIAYCSSGNKLIKQMEMIHLDKAFEIVMSFAFLTGTESVSFSDSLGRILAEDIISDIDMPPFNKSTMDGFACRKEDINHELRLIETIPAGKVPGKKISVDQCSKIMTGASLPAGADYVFMVEDSKVMASGMIKCTAGPFKKDNIAWKGEDARKGEILLKTGKQIRPQDIAVMAAVGHSAVVVRKLPGVAVISSGNELVEPDKKPGRSQIRNTNAYQLLAQIHRAGGAGKYYGIAPDEEKTTLKIISKAIAECDLVLISGGVSMGDFDFVPSVLERAGVTLHFLKIAVQPGKPTVFGTSSKALVFGLPGNPVSSFMQFELLVRPLISKMMGYKWHPIDVIFPMKDRYTRRSSDRLALIPVVITDEGLVEPVEYHGSGHVSALPDADGIIAVPVGKQIIEKGEQVSVRQI
jgi:molybdopterin molybdotransferase